MGATARLVVQMTPEEKASLEARARSSGLTTSEFVRRRVAEDSLGELEPHREEIEALLDTLERAFPNMVASIDHAIAETDGIRRDLDDIRAGRR
jgi:hypothetical protein